MNFSNPKKFWRARTSARAPLEYSTAWAKNPWFLGFHSDMRLSARRARKCARAQNFFTNVMFVTKSRCSSFCLIIDQKFIFLEQFEVWWKFLKFRNFRKNRLKKRFFIEKHQILMNVNGTYFDEFWGYKYDWGIKKHLLCSKILFWKIILPRAHFRARYGR